MKIALKCCIYTRMKRPAAIILIAALLVSCKQKLPTQYFVCEFGTEKCVITASFKDMKSCEFFKQMSGIYCDTTSNPDLIVCDTRRKSTKATSFCKPNVDSTS